MFSQRNKKRKVSNKDYVANNLSLAPASEVVFISYKGNILPLKSIY